MNRRKRRIIACLLALTLVLSSGGISALAKEDTGSTGGTVSEEPQEKTGSQTSGQDTSVEENGGEATGEQQGSETSSEKDQTQGETGTTTNGQPAENTQQTSMQVVGWNWIDEDGVLQNTENVWGLGVPGASEENPLTQDALLDMLPKEVELTLSDGSQKTAALTWDLSAIPAEGIWSGDVTVTATVDGTYSFTERTAPIEVKVELGGAETYTTLPSGSSTGAPFQSHLENGVSPAGTTINLFDYWLTGRTDADNSDPSMTQGTLYRRNYPYLTKQGEVPNLQNLGINNGHAFVFGANLGDSFGSWNQWTGSANPRSGVIQKHLSADGFPVLNLNQNSVNDARYTEKSSDVATGYYYDTLTNREPQESLAYLFDPSVESEGKVSYSDVQGLLQVDGEGYYYYDSTQNYAVFYEEDNTFALYDQGGVDKGGGGNGPEYGQFFPFNKATDVFTNNYSRNGKKSTDASLNHYFGLTMSTRFIQQNGGYTTSDKTKAVTYEFSGDDDVWVFIDDVLVADLGGIHNAASLKIDFSNGEIYINGQLQNQTLGQLLNTGTDTLPNNTYHTLDFFYLERGNTDSNMKLKYNLVTIPESSVIKVDQTGDEVAGAEFELYAANNLNKPIATGTTNRNGEFVFVDDEDFPITIEKLYDQYKDARDDAGNNLILKETHVPEGYRSNGDLGLRFHKTAEGEVLLLSNNQWDVGAYAMSKVTTTAPDIIVEAGGGRRQVNLRDAEDPLMFGAVFQKQDNGDWYPVSGDPLNGWNVADGNTWADVINAVRENPYTFYLASSGAYQIDIENLPGDITKYYHICGNENEAEYTVAYYYTSASTLAGVNGNNTWRIEPEAKNEDNQFDRVFSVNLYVPNIKNRLFIQKVDEEGTPVNGADFALYEENQVDVAPDGTVTVKEDQTPYDSRTTMHIEQTLDLDGGGVFPTTSKGKLERGVYYLIETSAPSGYVLNDTATKIVVDNTGVYADAGDADDGISVLKGVGSIVRSMVQFAVDDEVDTTLNGVKAGLTMAEYDDYNVNGSFTWGSVDWENADSVLHLQYENQYNVLDYGLTGSNEKGTVDTLTLKSETGWPKLLIQQCFSHDDSVDTSKKQNLGDTDVTKIFSGTTIVRVANQRVGDLRISKTVKGEDAPSDAQFTFEIELKDAEGSALSGTFDTETRTGTVGTVTVTDGKAERTLQSGESITIKGLPIGTTYKVVETEIPAGFTPSVTVDGVQSNLEDTASGTIPHNDAAEVAFINTYSNSVTLTDETALKVRKTLMGMTFSDNTKFQFNLTLIDENGQTITDHPNVEYAERADELIINGADSTNGVKTGNFGDIIFKAAGTYHFNIQETVPTGDAAIAGLSYDEHTAKVTVAIKKDADGRLSLDSVTYSNEGAPVQADADETTMAAFTNQLTSSFSFTKINRENQPLPDAVFALYELQCTENHDHSKDLIETEEDGSLSTDYENAGCWKFVDIVTSTAEGLVTFAGLPVGREYRLVEIKAPAGYTLPKGQWKVTYDGTKFTIEMDSAVGNPPAYKGTDGTIINYKPGELPFSGNIGIRMFLILGGALMAFGAAGGTWWYMHNRQMAAAGRRRRRRRR